MHGADQRFPMTPYRALFAVTHRNESRTGCASLCARKALILCGKSAAFFSDVIGGRIEFMHSRAIIRSFLRSLASVPNHKVWDANEIGLAWLSVSRLFSSPTVRFMALFGQRSCAWLLLSWGNKRR